MISKGQATIDDPVRDILFRLAELRARFTDPSTADEEKQSLADEYEVLVNQLSEDVQPYHRGMVGGDVVEGEEG